MMCIFLNTNPQNRTLPRPPTTIYTFIRSVLSRAPCHPSTIYIIIHKASVVITQQGGYAPLPAMHDFHTIPLKCVHASPPNPLHRSEGINAIPPLSFDRAFTCSRSNSSTSLSRHRAGTGRYAGLKVPMVCAHSPVSACVRYGSADAAAAALAAADSFWDESPESGAPPVVKCSEVVVVVVVAGLDEELVSRGVASEIAASAPPA